jgi:hypothetical protein
VPADPAAGRPDRPPASADQRGGGRWELCRSGSLSDDEYSGEIVSPVLAYEDLEQLQEVVRAVRRVGARADASTGIHVHVGGDRIDVKAISNLVKFMHKQEHLLELNPATAKYDFRVVLLRLGLIGDEFKTARLHLTKALAGSAAWKHERHDAVVAATSASTAEVACDRAAA